jgi:ABC-2 type transport system permease protein
MKIWGRIYALAFKEVLQIRRDPRTLVLALVMPVLLLLLFGYGVSFDIDAIPMSVVDQDRTSSSRRLLRRFFASGELRPSGTLSDPDEAYARFRTGQDLGAVVIPAGFQARLRERRPAPIQILVDAADGVTAEQTLGKAESSLKAGAVVRRSRPPVEVRTYTMFNPELRSALFLVPGLAAYVVALVSVLLTALTVAREWELGSMQQLFATPIRRGEIVIGKLLPYLALGLVAVALVIGSGALFFGVPMRGAPGILMLNSFLFVLGMLGQGLLISVLTKNQMVATQAAAMTSLLPSLLLSGFMFPIENMPKILQMITVIIPARYFIDTLRAVLLRGTPASHLWVDTVALAAFALAMIVLSTARFQRRIA